VSQANRPQFASTGPLPPLESDVRGRITVAFPPCSTELVGLVNTSDDSTPDRKEINDLFKEYFAFAHHQTLGHQPVGTSLRRELKAALADDLETCAGKEFVEKGADPDDVGDRFETVVWPSDCCICEPCVTLKGSRARLAAPQFGWSELPVLKRLFVGDVVWLYYFDRLGINQILGAILDAYAYSGRLPISNGALEVGIKDDIAAIVLEVMVRQVKMGLSSSVRDRTSLYRRAVGWSTDVGKRLTVDSHVNEGFSTLFHKFLTLALEFYRDKRLADAIQGANDIRIGGNVSQATKTALAETIELLKKKFEPFYYGRNYNNAVSGILWTIAGLSVLRELASTIGIPSANRELHEVVPAAYDLLVLKRQIQSGEANRYILHRDCAQHGRDILIQMEAINFTGPGSDAILTDWINTIEPNVEAYRSAYRSMTGVDLGTKTPPPTIEQQA
jgi:hypothetical protein